MKEKNERKKMENGEWRIAQWRISEIARLSICLSLAVVGCSLLAPSVRAVGTAAGTAITNGSDNGVAQSADQSGDAFVTWSGGGYSVFTATGVVVSTGYALSALSAPVDQGVLSGASVYFGYNFLNMGNAFDTFSISTESVAGGLNTMGSTITILRDDNWSGTYQNGEDTVITSTGLAPGASAYFLVRVFAPLGTADGSSVTYRVRVKDQNGLGTEEDWPSVASGDDNRVDEATATVSGAIISLAKGIALSTDTRPGGFVTFVATITNSGSGAATSVVFKDAIPSSMTYVSNSVTLSSGGSDAAKTDAGDADEVSYSAGVITVNVGTVNSASKAIVKFKVRIN